MKVRLKLREPDYSRGSALVPLSDIGLMVLLIAVPIVMEVFHRGG